VPTSLGSLTGLTYLDLRSNSLQGTLPSSFGSLVALNGSSARLLLTLSGLCSTTGSTPGSIEPNDGPLPACAPPPPPAPPPVPQFTCLNATFNDPGLCAALGQLYASLGGSGWGSTKGWANASAGIAVSYCDLFGVSCSVGPTAPVPTSLILASNSLEGILPSAIGSLTTLSVLRLTGGLLDGNLPSSLGSLTRLTQLWLYSNKLTGAIPASWGSLSALSQLLLQSNELLGSLPPALGSLTTLTQLSLASNRFTGTLPAAMASLTLLRILDARSNFMHGSVPAALAALTALDSVLLGGSGLCGTPPWPRAADDGPLPACSLSPNFACSQNDNPLVCTALGDLYASANGSGWRRNDGWAAAAAGELINYCAGPAIYYGVQCNGSRILRLQLSGNQLSGSVPDTIGNLGGDSLQLIDLSSNNLSGSLPPSFASLSSLTGLTLSDSGLCGPVPSAAQPNDGKLPSCPNARSVAAEVVVDTILIVCTVVAGVVAAAMARKAWLIRGSLQRLREQAEPTTLDEASAEEPQDAFFEAAAGPPDADDAAALKAALLPESRAPIQPVGSI